MSGCHIWHILSHVHKVIREKKQQCFGVFHFSEDKHGCKIPITPHFTCTDIQLQQLNKPTSHDIEGTDIIMPQIEMTAAYSLGTQTHLGHGMAIFQELGSILSPDEELCMDHLRSGSGRAEL